MELRRLYEEYKKIREEISLGYPVKLTPRLARHAIEFGLNEFVKLSLGPLRKLVPQAILALPGGSIIEVQADSETADYYYNNGEAWFTSEGKKITVDKLVTALKDFIAPNGEMDKNNLVRAVGWKPRPVASDRH